MTTRPDHLFLDPTERLQQLFLEGDPFPLETITHELALVDGQTSDPAVLHAIQRHQSQKSEILGKMLSSASDYAVNRVAVERGDWLYAEGWISRALTVLVWTSMYASEQFSLPNGNREERLRDFCSRFSAEETLESILDSRSQRQQLDSLITLCLKSIEFLREIEGEISVGSEEELRVLSRDPDRMKLWPPHPSSDEAKQSNLDEVETVLRGLPWHIGTMLIGSFGSENKRDPFSDVDVNCICSELPTREQQANVLAALQGEDTRDFSWPGFGCFLPLGLSATVVHMSFISQANQEALFERRKNQGTEFPLIEITNERFAVGSYYWSHSRILSDRDGSLQAYRQKAERIPKKYRDNLEDTFQQSWDYHHAMFLKAEERGDRVSALTALNSCTEAVFRAFMLKYDIHTDPITPTKWLPIEFKDLPSSRVESMEASGLVPKGASAPWSDRFTDIGRLGRSPIV